MYSYYRIRYTDKRTGCKIWYMNIGFETVEQAERELKLLKKNKAKYKKLGLQVADIYRGCFKIIPLKTSSFKKV